MHLLAFLSVFQLTAHTQCDTNCDVQCIGQLNLSLSEDCETEVTPWMGGVDITPFDPCYEVVVYDQHNRPILDNIVNLDHLDDNLTYKVSELECGNYCWGNVKVEYKLAPKLECPPDLTIQCNALDYLCLPPATGGCAPFIVQLYDQQKTKLSCDEDYQAIVRRTYIARDDFGNIDSCSHRIWLKRIEFDSIKFPGPAEISCSNQLIQYQDPGRCIPIPWYFTGSGAGLPQGVPILCNEPLPAGYACDLTTGSGSTIPLIPGGGGILIDPDSTITHIDPTATSAICNSYLTYTDIEFPPINGGCKKKIARNWEVREWWCTDELTVGGMQLISIVDDMPPEFNCPPDRIVSTTSDCASDIYLPGVNPVDQCGDSTHVRIEYAHGFVDGDGGYAHLELGHNDITYRVSDACHNTATCHVVYTVKDLKDPVAVCEADKVVSISTNINTLVPAEVFDNGSHDDCSIAKMEVGRMTNVCNPGIEFGSKVTLRHTYQSQAHADHGGTGGSELPIEAIQGVPAGSLSPSANITPGEEFPYFLDLYDINVNDNHITFHNLIRPSNEPYDGYLRVIEPGTYYRYYFDFDLPHGINSTESDDEDIRVWVETDTQIIVEVGPGYDLSESGFSIELDRFGPYVQFCCEDVLADEVMVIFRVSDHSGNSSICMVAVEVQDKAIPNLLCPDDVTIDCQDTYDHNNMDATFGSPSMSDNCPSIQLPNVEMEENLDQCGIGTITRVFKLTDELGNVTRSCKQIITITNNTPFIGTDIIWPVDYSVEGCDYGSLDPEQLEPPYDYPSYYVSEDQCALLGYDYDDKQFEATPGEKECSVIHRTWKVINWCTTVEGTFDIWESPNPQVLKLENNNPPELDENIEVIVESMNADCKSGEFHILKFATDDCTTDLIWEYVIRHKGDSIIVKRGDTNEIYGNFVAGEYTVDWVVRDGCGNIDTQTQDLTIINNKAPTPVCHNGLSATLIGWDTDGDGALDSEAVELWASDFNASSYHNCGNELTYSFSADTTDKFIIYDCSHLGRQYVEMWVTDIVTGSQDFCIAFIDIQDEGMCPDELRVAVTGQVYTETDQEVEGVEISLGDSVNFDMTDNGGSYAFNNMPMGGDYMVEPSRDLDYLNGISTVDVIRIQRHILGLDILESPYKMIAADINHDEKINGIDLVELRKLILGIYTELPENTSWRFVSEEFVFPDPVDPWSTEFPEEYEILGISTDMNIDFIGVKIGDVNNSVELAAGPLVDSRFSRDGVDITFSEPESLGNEQYMVSVIGSGYSDIVGWQGALSAPGDIEITGMSSEHFDLVENENFHTSGDNRITISYNNESPVSLSDGTALMNIYYSTHTGTVPDFNWENEGLQAELYNSNLDPVTWNIDSPLVSDINLTISPNPWIHETTINVDVPEGDEARLEFYDVNGRLLYKEKTVFTSDNNSLRMTKSALNVSGLVYVKVITEGNISQYKMLVL